MLSLSDKLNFIQRAFGAYSVSRDGRNVDVRCPICAPQDRLKRKMSILTDDTFVRDGVEVQSCLGCHCWTCGYQSRSLWKLLLEHGTQELFLEYRDRFLPESMRHRAYVDDFAPVKKKVRLPDDFRLLATIAVSDPDVLAVKRYLTFDRRVSDDDMWFFKLGVSDEPRWRRRVIVPSFDKDGELNHFVARTIDRRAMPRYDAPDGDRHSVIFNEVNIDWSRRLTLCEGAFDLMKCGDNAVPLLGSSISSESALFNSIVAHRTPVALALDADMRLTKTPKVAKKLMDYDIDVVIVNVPSDPGDMSKQEFRRALAAAQPLDWQRTFMDRLERASQIRL